MRKSLVVLFALLLAVVAGESLAQSSPAKTPEPKIKVGSTAPDFTLKDQSGKDVSLKDFRGKKNVVLAFYIFAFTGG